MHRTDTGQRIERPVSAGGVVYRVNGKDNIEALLCGRIDPPLWSLPKGTPDEGESLEETALREVREETGMEARIQAPLGHTNYWFLSPDRRVRYYKTVHFYLMAAKGGCTDQHDIEFDEVRWFPIEDGLKILTYGNEAGVLEKALTIIRSMAVEG